MATFVIIVATSASNTIYMHIAITPDLYNIHAWSNVSLPCRFEPNPMSQHLTQLEAYVTMPHQHNHPTYHPDYFESSALCADTVHTREAFLESRQYNLEMCRATWTIADYVQPAFVYGDPSLYCAQHVPVDITSAQTMNVSATIWASQLLNHEKVRWSQK